jgi:ADP-heptose:LPS heptosyltransferase
MRKIIFRHMVAPGDVLMMLLAVRELHNTYPNQFITDIVSPYPEITYNAPFLTKLIENGMKDPDAEIIDVDYNYELSRSSESGKHFSDGYITNINHKLGLSIKKKSMYPLVYLTDEEKNIDVFKKYNLPEKFWLINAGIKSDIPLKSWRIDHWEKLIYKLKDEIFLVQVGSNKDIHPDFDNKVTSLVGKTENLRDFIILTSKSQGSIGPISLHMHLMACFKKSCIVIAGGRETPTWEMYPIHQVFHTVGMLDCCRYGGCRKSQRQHCYYMVGKQKYPLCMSMITVNQVYKSILGYIDNV